MTEGFGGFKRGPKHSSEFNEKMVEVRKRKTIEEKRNETATKDELAAMQEKINEIIENESQDQKTIAELKEKINAIFENRGE
jgi:hypothetical protein